MSGQRAARCLNGVVRCDGGWGSDSCAWGVGEDVEPCCVYQQMHVCDVGRMLLTVPDNALEDPQRWMSRCGTDVRHHQGRR